MRGISSTLARYWSEIRGFLAPHGASDWAWIVSMLAGVVGAVLQSAVFTAWWWGTIEEPLAAVLSVVVVGFVTNAAGPVLARFFEARAAAEDRREKERLQRALDDMNEVIRLRLFVGLDDLVVINRALTTAMFQNTIAFPAADDNLDVLLEMMDALCVEIASAVGRVLKSEQGVTVNAMVVVDGDEAERVIARLEEHVRTRDSGVPAYTNPYTRVLRETELCVDGCPPDGLAWMVAILIGSQHGLAPVYLRVPRAPRDVLPGAPRAIWALGHELGLVGQRDDGLAPWSYSGTIPPPLELIDDTHKIPPEHDHPADQAAHRAVEDYFKENAREVRGLVSVAAYAERESGHATPTILININLPRPGMLSENWNRHVTQVTLLPFLPLAADLGAAIRFTTTREAKDGRRDAADS